MDDGSLIFQIRQDFNDRERFYLSYKIDKKGRLRRDGLFVISCF